MATKSLLFRKISKVIGFIVLGIILLIGAFVIMGLYVTRKLPWQTPIFDTVRPADLGTIGSKGVLIFSKTNGFRHESIKKGIEAFQKAGKERGWDVRATENGAFFTDDYLKQFKVVVFLSTTGDILTPEQKKSFASFIENGGGYVGIHSACDTEYDWTWYDHLIGTHFRDHTLFPEQLPEAVLVTEIKDHPATKHLPIHWKKSDEWYNFKQNVRGKGNIQVLLSVDESSYSASWPKAMGGDHPISWTNQINRGRMFYSALGHTEETFTDRYSFLHLVMGIEWAGQFVK
ncbi:ThuA domain-containing protein [Cytophagaceae bacterium YF14B1]|uniref:ThuA domain-containing protein n=1 Tax=Xanthocytophaga flava TaxID=3048013 RepID=A0AAE3U8X4_9BACT|nr:ThuA domain-containing protein [Xanthocytophaga flavus]MDJ1481159.1 ThuA domain-containing protein [Xanthocytophaga flavus]